jgi:5-formyltetrahydrofolate cyclo-ligase
MAYASFGSEFETGDFIADALARGKTLVLPRVERDSRILQLRQVRDPARQLVAGVWGILQPRADLCPLVPASQLDFLLVPGVAFTRHCERLGYGGGYYDTFIRGLVRRAPLVAAAFSIQILPALPVSERDQSVDCVVTENVNTPSLVRVIKAPNKNEFLLPVRGEQPKGAETLRITPQGKAGAVIFVRPLSRPSPGLG